MKRGGSILVLAGLVLASACAPRRGGDFTPPVPRQLQTVVAIDKDGNQIVAGSFAGRFEIANGSLTSAGGTDIFVAKVDKNAALVFPAQRFGGTGDDAATGVAVNEDGSVILAGTFQGEAEFGTQRLKANVRHAGQRAVFVARIEPTGAVGWVKQIAVANLPTQVSVAVGPDKNIVVGATTSGTVLTKDGPMKLAGESITLEFLDPKGEPARPAGAQLRAMSLLVGCVHSPCTTGGALTAGCGPNACVAWICTVDPFCCNNWWDSWCVEEVGSVCHMRCNCDKICATGNPYYPDACACVAQVYTVDPYCGETGWDATCIQEANQICHTSCQ